MNDNTIDVDQTDEDILTSEVSDEELEAAAGTGMGPGTSIGGAGCQTPDYPC